MVQGNLLGLPLPHRCGFGAGRIRTTAGSAVLGAADHHTGDRVNVVGIVFAVGGECYLIVICTIPVLQVRRRKGGCALRDAGGVQGNRFGRVRPKITGLGTLLAAACQHQAKHRSNPKHPYQFSFHLKTSFFILALSYHGNMKGT